MVPSTRKISRAHRLGASASARKRTAASSSWTLLVIDDRPLQRAAWAEFHTARKRLEKTSRDLHRHEEIDCPAYDAWLHRTFPRWVTTLRELYQELSVKRQQVQTVIAMSELTGRSLKKLWREQKEQKPTRDAGDEQSDGGHDERDPRARRKESARGFRDTRDDTPSAPRAAGADKPQAREIYRRLVQRLHPDRGGTWTPARMRLWHEVQQAWAIGDEDWLTRLEVEWETANEVLGPTSPLSRLRQAIAELLTARRDIERKLREYRQSPQWRFTLSEKKRANLHALTEDNFRHDVALLRSQLEHLNSTIAAWEDRADPKPYKVPARPYDARKRSWTDF